MKLREIDKSSAIGRASSPFMDNILGWSFPVLDHGMVRVIDYMGNEGAVIQAARVSYGAGTKSVRSDRSLMRYLLRREHTTPFEMCEVKLHVKLPIFVARQWIRHRTANVNEYSARYSILDGEFYIPETEDMAKQSTENNQGRGHLIPYDKARELQRWLIDSSQRSYQEYQDTVRAEEDGGRYGLARELARMNLPANIYTQWYWKVDLHNLLRFLRLRADHHAQYEIRVYAEAILSIVAGWVPLIYDAAQDYLIKSANMSRMELELLRSMVKDHRLADPDAMSRYGADLGMSSRELSEFRDKLAL